MKSASKGKKASSRLEGLHVGPQKDPALTSPVSWILGSFRYFLTEIFGYEIAPHHENIIRHFEETSWTLDLAPRGSGKTRIGTIAYAAYRALQNPDIRVLIVSDTDLHAQRFLATIKNAIEYNQTIRKYGGSLKGDKWTGHEMVLKGRTKVLTEATVTALGAMSGAVTSGHYDIIIADDLVNFDNARTEGKREIMRDWFRTSLIPTLIPGGELRVLGTRYHFLDLYQTLLEDFDIDVQVQQAIQYDQNGEERSIWEMYMPLEDRVLKSGKVIKGLRRIREEVGSIIFDLQMQNNVELMKKGDIFHYDWFRWFTIKGDKIIRDDGAEIPLSELRIYSGIDPAVSEQDRADYFVIVTIGVHVRGKETDYYVLDVLRDRLSYERRGAMVNAKWQQWRPRVMGLEDVGFQMEFTDRIRKSYPFIRIKPIKTIKDKTSRAYARSGLVENGKVHIKQGLSLFVEELCLMPDGEHDDQFDGFDFAMAVSSAVGGVIKTEQLPASKKYGEFGGKTYYEPERQDIWKKAGL